MCSEFKGGISQEAASAVTQLGTTACASTRWTLAELTGADEGQAYQTYGYEYQGGGGSNAYVTWLLGGNPTWRLNAAAFKPDATVDVGQRLISVEPMSIVRPA